MFIGIKHIPSSIKRAIETVAKHNLLHDLGYYLNIKGDDKKDPHAIEVPNYSGSMAIEPAKVDKEALEHDIVSQHKSCHDYLLEYPEFADEFYEGRLDDTLDATMKAAFIMTKAKARRVENDKRDAEEMMEKGGALLDKLIACHTGKEEGEED